MEPASAPVEHNPAAHRFEVRLGDRIAMLRYRVANGAITFVHTEVPREFEGHGIGTELARAGIEFARAQHLQVIPLCPFIGTYIGRHPEHLDLVPEEYRDRIPKG